MTAKPGNWGRWGDDDQRGMLNLIGPEKVLEATALVRTGRVIPLAIPLKADSPVWPGRHKNWHIATFQNLEGPGLGGAEDILMIHTHGSTHTDALCHIADDGLLYNGFKAEDVIGSAGTSRNGIDNVGSIVTRGILIDVAGLLGVDHLAADHVITPAETEKCLEAAGLEVRPGDALLFRTGWMKTWATAPDRFNASQPGIGLEVGLWAAERDIAIIAADNTAVEAFPGKSGFLPVHRDFIRDRGGYLMELFDLEALAAQPVREFMFVVAPLNIARGLGSPITPLAIL